MYFKSFIKKIIFLAIIATIITNMAYASKKTKSKTVPHQINLSEKIKDVHTIISDFEQSTTMKGYGTEKYKGKFYLKNKERALWDYSQPYEQYYIFNKDGMDYYDSSTQQLVKQRNNKKETSNAILQILFDFSGIDKSFSISTIESNKVKLIPKSEMGINYIIMTLRNNTISEIFSEDRQGNGTKIKFINMKINKDIDDTVFEKTVPPNTQIFNY